LGLNDREQRKKDVSFTGIETYRILISRWWTVINSTIVSNQLTGFPLRRRNWSENGGMFVLLVLLYAKAVGGGIVVCGLENMAILE